MEKDPEKIYIMKGFLPYFRILTAYNFVNFSGHWTWTQMLRKFGQFLFVFIFFGSDVIFNILSHWHYIEKHAAIDPKALPILFIGYQILLTHISGVKNNRLMTDTLYRLQIAIEPRQFITSIDLNIIVEFLNIFNWWIAIFVGTENAEIFKKLEQTHAFITHNFFFKAPILTIFIPCMVAGLFPISYAIVGYPTPDKWIVPIEIQ